MGDQTIEQEIAPLLKLNQERARHLSSAGVLFRSRVEFSKTCFVHTSRPSVETLLPAEIRGNTVI